VRPYLPIGFVAALIEAIEKVTTTRAVRFRVRQSSITRRCSLTRHYDNGIFWGAPHSTLGAVEQLGSSLRFSRTPVTRAHAGPPLDSTAKVLAEISHVDRKGDDRHPKKACADCTATDATPT
jgi:hypothetical protein